MQSRRDIFRKVIGMDDNQIVVRFRLFFIGYELDCVFCILIGQFYLGSDQIFMNWVYVAIPICEEHER